MFTLCEVFTNRNGLVDDVWSVLIVTADKTRQPHHKPVPASLGKLKPHTRLGTRRFSVPCIDLPLGIGEDRLTGAMDIEKAMVEGRKTFHPALLDRIQTLSHQANVLFGETAFRFAATKAYSTIVARRLKELAEERIPGYSRPSTFLNRRMTPAIDHCAATGRQRDTLERRLSETSQMLRTKVETGLAEQNKQLLEQIKTSTQSQVKLQRAVEGFSVVAISYYLVSILAIFLKGGEKAGLFSGWEIYEAILAPAAIIAVIILVRRAAGTRAP